MNYAGFFFAYYDKYKKYINTYIPPPLPINAFVFQGLVFDFFFVKSTYVDYLFILLTHHPEADGRRADLQQRRQVEVVGRQQRLEEQLVPQAPDEGGVPLLHVVAHGLAVRDGLLVCGGLDRIREGVP